MKKIKFLKVATAFILGLSTIGTIASPAYAADYEICDDGNVPESTKRITGCPGYAQEDTFQSTLIGILNAVIGIAGLVAVIFIIVGGINYMTSAGDAQKVEKGKKTILYALIGLVVCALAFAIVNWVIVGVLKQNSNGGSTASHLIENTIAFFIK